MITLDGVTYNIPVISLTRTADFLDKYAERTEDGDLHRELIGVYFNYKLELGTPTDPNVYDAVWNKLTEPEEFHTVVIPDGVSGTRSFTAYFANVTDKLRRLKGTDNYWSSLTVNFISKSPTRN
jgi:hypothetical protein